MTVPLPTGRALPLVSHGAGPRARLVTSYCGADSVGVAGEVVTSGDGSDDGQLSWSRRMSSSV